MRSWVGWIFSPWFAAVSSPACLSGKVRVRRWSQWWAPPPPAHLWLDKTELAVSIIMFNITNHNVALPAAALGTGPVPLPHLNTNEDIFTFQILPDKVDDDTGLGQTQCRPAHQTELRTDWIFRLSTLPAHDSWINWKISLKSGSLQQLAVKLITFSMFPSYFL